MRVYNTHNKLIFKEMIIAKKGYTLSVTSWENDGDYYNTKENTFTNKEDAVLTARLLNEFISSICNDDYHHEEEIVEYFSKNPEMRKLVLGDYEDELDENSEEYGECLSESLREYTGDFLGYSEWYTYRVPDNISLYYVPETVEAEEVKF
jgi:hypothetical protein